MSDQNNASAPSEAPNSSKAQSGAPYEASLAKAFDKLTSQIFIFLLAYVILLIGVAVFGSELPNMLRNLFYIIPVLGVIAYVWLQQREIVKDANDKGIDVKAGIVKGAKVKGVLGATGDLPKNVKLRVGLASDNAEVTAVEYGRFDEPKSETPQSIDAQQLINIFQQLDEADQSNLLISAMRMRSKSQRRE